LSYLTHYHWTLSSSTTRQSPRTRPGRRQIAVPPQVDVVEVVAAEVEEVVAVAVAEVVVVAGGGDAVSSRGNRAARTAK
jgi:hypothetical protein